MTPQELLAHLANDCDEPLDVVTDILLALADTVEEQLRAGHYVTIPGLGSFSRYIPPTPSQSVQIQWASDPGLRARVVGPLNAAARRTPAPTGPMTPARAQRMRTAPARQRAAR